MHSNNGVIEDCWK